jgi:hypothetical protein
MIQGPVALEPGACHVMLSCSSFCSRPLPYGLRVHHNSVRCCNQFRYTFVVVAVGLSRWQAHCRAPDPVVTASSIVSACDTFAVSH